MEFTAINEAFKKGSGEVSIRGWVYRERTTKNFKFIVLRDNTSVIQCIVDSSKFPDKYEQADKIQIETSMTITGTLRKEDRAPGGFELDVTDFTIVGPSDKFPISKDQSPEFLLDNRHLWIRSRKMQAILKVKATVLAGFREFYDKQGFQEFTPPIMQPLQCEGGSTLFEIKYYNDVMYLSQSWQLYGEAGIMGLEKLYTISPCFRAEKSKTSRHLSEFWMAEMEQAWIELPELLDSVEGCITHIVKKVVETNEEELKFLGQDVEKLKKIVPPFPRLKYDDVLKILKEKEGMEIEWGKDLRTIEEDKLMNHYDKPVIITHYPTKTMAFYKPADPENPETSLCVDVIAPEGYGEIVGGSQRSLDVEDMKKRLQEENEDPANYQWYFDLRKYGGVPHSGYGLGVERVVAWLCKLDNIKDAIPFPRTMLRYKP